LSIFKTKNCCSPRRFWVQSCFAIIISPDAFRRFSKVLLAKESCLAYALENEQFFHCRSSSELLPNATLAINNNYFSAVQNFNLNEK
jgi:hypothetical protein